LVVLLIVEKQGGKAVSKNMFGLAAYGLAIGMIAMLSAQVMAKTVGSKPKTVTGSAVVTGSSGEIVPGACTSTTDAYADICPSGTCECFTIADAKLSGKLFGSGSADVTATIDLGDALLASASPETCLPTFGDAVLTLSDKAADTETINFLGALCAPATVKGKASAGGAWQIIDSTNNESGLGTVTGEGIIGNTGDINITLSGSATTTP
jgi:hypothetical protein